MLLKLEEDIQNILESKNKKIYFNIATKALFEYSQSIEEYLHDSHTEHINHETADQT